MNPKLQIFFNRRSVRSYTNETIDDSIIQDLLEAAMSAPSAVAKDPWHFYVVRDQATRDKIADALPNGQMLRSAPVGIIVVGDIDKAHDSSISYMLQDCSAAVENLLLAASMLDLGACWLGVHPREDRIAFLKEIFELPKNMIPISAIAIGHPAQHPEPRTRYREECVHTDKC
jgi:nitroreductase